MDRKLAEGHVMASALVVGTVWGYRKLIEPAGSAAGFAKNETALKRIIGAEPQPATVPEFAIAFSFTYLTLSTVAIFAPELASGFALIVLVGELLTNGASVFTDVNHAIAENAQRASSGAPTGQARQPVRHTRLSELPQATGFGSTLGTLG